MTGTGGGGGGGANSTSVVLYQGGGGYGPTSAFQVNTSAQANASAGVVPENTDKPVTGNDEVKCY